MNDTLSQIEQKLATSTPLQIIEELLPRNREDAIAWARRFPLWEEQQHSRQVIAIARLISRRAMREHRLIFDAEGHVVDEKQQSGRGNTTVFPMQIGDKTIKVEYSTHYFPNSSESLFSFIGEQEDGKYKPHPLSETGWWSQFVPQDAVDACGGPEAFATLLAEAKLRGEDQQLIAAFKGQRPEEKPRRKRKPVPERQAEPRPVLGEHTAAVVEKRQEQPSEEQLPVQGKLF